MRTRVRATTALITLAMIVLGGCAAPASLPPGPDDGTPYERAPPGGAVLEAEYLLVGDSVRWSFHTETDGALTIELSIDAAVTSRLKMAGPGSCADVTLLDADTGLTVVVRRSGAGMPCGFVPAGEHTLDLSADGIVSGGVVVRFTPA